jgi:hypothetical protein
MMAQRLNLSGVIFHWLNTQGGQAMEMKTLGSDSCFTHDE